LTPPGRRTAGRAVQSSPPDAQGLPAIQATLEEAAYQTEGDAQHHCSSVTPPTACQAEIDDEVDEIIRALVEADSIVDDAPSTAYSLEEFSAYVPKEVVEFVRSLTRTEWLAFCTLSAVDEHICRRLRPDTIQGRRNRWNSKWTKQRPGTEARIRREKNIQARRYHWLNTYDHQTYRTLPTFFRPWRPQPNGTLLVHDPQKTNPSIGAPGFMEQTPVKLLRWVHETWLGVASLLGDDDGDVDLDSLRRPKVWDLTCGSGTSLDYFQTIEGCKVLARDLTLAAGGVEFGCASEFHKSDNVTGRRALPGSGLPNLIRRPDIILFDPPSRGTPTHSELCGEDDRRDLAEADRESWIGLTVDTAKRAATYLAPGGVVSFLVRHGVRDGGRVTDDPQLLEDVRHELQRSGRRELLTITITNEMPIDYGRRRNQASLGRARVPATHLLLTGRLQ
jgi:hypothetical protein